MTTTGGRVAAAAASTRAWPRTLAYGQGAYLFATGIWPVVHIASFQWLTGPKVDLWLVKATGLQLACIGVFLLRAARRGRLDRDAAVLATSSALTLAAIDVYYAAVVDVIADIYLVDAALEGTFALLWIAAARRRG